jgi:DNA-binding MarR family transcriptional regulator
VSKAPKTTNPNDTRIILDSIRLIVQSLRLASKQSEKALGLSAAQLFVLQKIGESPYPLSINHLAERTLTHQSSVSVVVAKLLKRKLVERRTDANDGRVVNVALTKAGQKILKDRPPLIQDQLVRGIEMLTKAERDALMAGLKALVRKSGLSVDMPALFFEEEGKRK